MATVCLGLHSTIVRLFHSVSVRAVSAVVRLFQSVTVCPASAVVSLF